MRTTLDPKLQVLARKTLTDGLVKFDESAGLARPGQQDRHRRRLGRQARRGARRSTTSRRGGSRWCSRPAISRRASACSPDASRAASSARSATVGIAAARRREVGEASSGKALEQGQPGAQARRRRLCRAAPRTTANIRLRQVPEVSGAMVVMDPLTGRVLAMVGGFSYDQSQFNRATQALRQPGSSFKPIVYAAALDNGYTPSTLVLDAPIEIDQGPGIGVWRPENYERQVLRALDAALRHRAFAQRDDGAAGAGHRHAADRRICQALRRLRQPAALSVVRARRRRDHACCAWSPPIRCSTTAGGA